VGFFGRKREDRIRVHVLLRGRIGEGWHDVDQHLELPRGATLDELLTAADAKGLALRAALAASPHLADTLMLNGERTPVETNRDRVLADGDELYLLAPLAGG
jgi:molybdopterin converting factor small subunit